MRKQTNRHEAVFENIKDRIQAEIRAAHNSIFAAVAWLTEPDLIRELTRAVSRGCSVRLIISAHEYNQAERFRNLVTSGGELYIYGSEDIMGRHFMHNKFCVIDYQKVITGSFNYTWNASSNAENIVILHDEAVAYQYVEECLDLIKGAHREDFGNAADISVSFLPASTLVEKGESVKIVWKVEKATSVSSPLLGNDLPYSGAHTLLIHHDQVLQLFAENPEQEKVVTVQIRMVRHPKIKYFSVSEQVIIRSQKTVLRWKVEDSNEVILKYNGQTRAVEEEGEFTVTPTTDTEYELLAIGDKKTERQVVRVLVYPLPTFKAIPVPVPTEISLEADLNIFQNKIFTALSFEHTQIPMVQRVPKVERLLLKELLRRPKVQEIADAYGKKMHEMQLPISAKHDRFKGLKSSILEKVAVLFENNPKALKIISQIKETYGLD